MKTNFLLISIILFVSEFFLYCNSSENDCVKKVFMKPDLTAEYVQDGEIVQLTAFKAPENGLILAENNSRNYGKLKWFSIGYPMLVKTKSEDNEFFHFTRSGFS